MPAFMQVKTHGILCLPFFKKSFAFPHLNRIDLVETSRPGEIEQTEPEGLILLILLLTFLLLKWNVFVVCTPVFQVIDDLS